jgi:hypothetical protein
MRLPDNGTERRLAASHKHNEGYQTAEHTSVVHGLTSLLYFPEGRGARANLLRWLGDQYQSSRGRAQDGQHNKCSAPSPCGRPDLGPQNWP